MLFRKTLLASLAAVAVQPAFAAEPSVELDTVIVTASRVAEPLSDTLAPVTVITRADIERLQPRDFQDLLVGLPGISIANNGGSGKTTSVRMRGTNADSIIVLIDGIKVGSATLGTTAFEQIPVDLIDRIEIVRGPRSSLYGSEAIGGVIQIFTKHANKGDAISPSFALSGGSQGSAKEELGVRGSVGDGWYSLGLTANTTDGINAKPTSGQPDRDGFRNVAGSLNTGWRFDNGAEVSGNWLRAKSRNQYDGYGAAGDNNNDGVQQVFGGRASFSPVKIWQVTLSGGESQDLSENFHKPDVGGQRSIFNTFRDSYSWQNDVRLGEHQQISLGVDNQHDRVSSNSADYSKTSRDDTGEFAQYQVHFGGHDAQASFRHDDNSQFGKHDTGALAYGYRFGNGLRVGASHGTAFRAPSFNQLYYPYYGTATLKPESTRSSELNVSGSQTIYGTSTTWALNGYRTIANNLIDTDPNTYTAVNVGKARILGVEAQLGARWQAVRAQTTLNWLEPENRVAGPDYGKILPRRPQKTARLDVDYDLCPKASVGTTLYGATKSLDTDYDANFNAITVRNTGYGTMDLRAAYSVLPNWLLQVKASNLLNKHYQTAYGYDQVGAGYFLTVRYNPSSK